MDLILFGAGKTGEKFIKSKAYNQIKNNYSNIMFCDNNETLIGTKLDNIDVVKFPSKKEKNDIVITSEFFWGQIYDQCLKYTNNVIRIWDYDDDCLREYKEMCQVKKAAYHNEAYIKYAEEKARKVTEGVEKFKKSNNLYENITEVAIGLSNLCNYAIWHKKCPANCIQDKVIMPSKVVFKIINELASVEFAGTICFQIYNEPMIDPRLFWFIQYIKEKLPNVKVEVYSNGYYLNEVMVEELQECGVDILFVTAYGKEEYDRLLGLNVDIAYGILFGNLDGRLNYYEDREKSISKQVCKSFISQVAIYPNGDVGICCLDYKHPYNLGNILEKTLEECLNSEKIVEFQKELLKGNREQYAICKNCTWER